MVVVVAAAVVAVVAVVAESRADAHLSVQCWRCQNAGFFEEARVCFL